MYEKLRAIHNDDCIPALAPNDPGRWDVINAVLAIEAELDYEDWVIGSGPTPEEAIEDAYRNCTGGR